MTDSFSYRLRWELRLAYQRAVAEGYAHEAAVSLLEAAVHKCAAEVENALRERANERRDTANKPPYLNNPYTLSQPSSEAWTYTRAADLVREHLIGESE